MSSSPRFWLMVTLFALCVVGVLLADHPQVTWKEAASWCAIVALMVTALFIIGRGL